MTVNSNCIAICSSLFDKECRGCGRTQEEVDNWVIMTEEEQQAAVDRARAKGTAICFQREKEAF